jgi:hypothetical protein
LNPILSLPKALLLDTGGFPFFEEKRAEEGFVETFFCPVQKKRLPPIFFSEKKRKRKGRSLPPSPKSSIAKKLRFVLFFEEKKKGGTGSFLDFVEKRLGASYRGS